jgi:hypothetical protein
VYDIRAAVLFVKKPEFDRNNGGVLWDNGGMMNFTFLRPVMACLMVSTLTACGGGGGSDPVDEVVIPDVPDGTTPDTSTTGQRAAATALLATWAPTNPPVYTSLAAVPTTGGADFDGYVFGELANDSDDITDSVIGALTLDVDFNATGATFSGSATDFVGSDDTDLTGTLTVTGGELNRNGSPASDATIDVSLAGTLTDNAAHDLVFGFELEGDFLGSDYNAVGGEALGSVTVDGIDQDFDGGFIAER